MPYLLHSKVAFAEGVESLWGWLTRGGPMYTIYILNKKTTTSCLILASAASPIFFKCTLLAHTLHLALYLSCFTGKTQSLYLGFSSQSSLYVQPTIVVAAWCTIYACGKHLRSFIHNSGLDNFLKKHLSPGQVDFKIHLS